MLNTHSPPNPVFRALDFLSELDPIWHWFLAAGWILQDVILYLHGPLLLEHWLGFEALIWSPILLLPLLGAGVFTAVIALAYPGRISWTASILTNGANTLLVVLWMIYG